MKKYIPKLSFGYMLKLFVFFIIYFVTAKFGLSMFAVNTFATPIWVPTGLALAVLILYGYDLWPAVAVGAFVVNISTGASVVMALGIAIGNTLEALFGTYLVRKYVQIYRCFERLRDTLLFIGIVSFVATVISATIGVATLYLGGHLAVSQLGDTWLAWWIGDTLSALVLTPFLLTWIRPTREWNPNHLKWFEICGIVLTLFLTNLAVFWYNLEELRGIPLLYIIIFPLIWSVIRMGSRGITLSILVTSVVSAIGTLYGHGPFVTNPIETGIASLQFFIGTISMMCLIFLSVVKERKQATLKLHEHVNELEYALQKIKSEDKAKNDFLAILSHELRNPLAPILSSLEMLKTDIAENTKAERLLETMETHVHTMSHLLDDLLDISRISRRKFKLNTETFSLQSVITHSVNATENEVRAKNQTLSIVVPEETLWLVGDPIRIEQVLVNLIINARKYTPEYGNITVSCKVEEDVILVSVKDDGLGIDHVLLQKIFEPFLQASRDNKRSDGGLGIGLALTKKLVELHNGHIVAKSDGLGLGSEFVVTLPVAKNIIIPLGITETTQKSPHQEARKYKILVVDDNQDAADGIRELLRYSGHTVESTYESVGALELVKSFAPQVIILDIGLPIIDGYELARQIRGEKFGNITLIALTGYGQESDKTKARESGFDHHMTKPVSIFDIKDILNSL